MPTFDDVVRNITHASGPCLTYYGEDGRIELTGPVLLRWCDKIAGLLLDEALITEQARVAIDIPASWRHLVWVLGALRAGALPCEPDLAYGNYSVAVCSTIEGIDRALAAGIPDVYAQPLASLALAWTDALPAGAEDAAQAVMSQPDALVAVPHDIDTSWTLGGRELARVLTPRDDLDGRFSWISKGPWEDAARAIGVWVSGGSCVITTDPCADVSADERAVAYPAGTD